MRFLVLQQVECEGPGLFGQFMLDRHIAFDRVGLYAGDPLPDLSSYDALLVMGGPMSVYDDREHPFLVEENHLINRAVRESLPFLGICLGGQLLAKALGAPVMVNAAREIGFDHIFLTEEGKKDPIFQGLSNPLPVFQWHGDTFTIPQGATHLAASDACAHQAFRYGQKVYALQFHLEVTPAMLRQWAWVYQEELEALGQEARERVLSRDLDNKCDLLKAEAERLFDNFVLIAKKARII